jgi:DNA polymerase-3 subunit delta
LKIPPKDIDKFILNVPKSTKAVLLYGPDNGLVRMRMDLLRKARNLIQKFNYDQIKNNPIILLDHLSSQSLFLKDSSKEKMISIECNGAGFTESCRDLLKGKTYQGLLVFYAGDLGTDSALRKFFESNNNVAAVACYRDDAVSITVLIQQIFKKKQINIERSAIQLLVNSITTGDRMLIINEIEKICLFLGDKKSVVEEDLQGYLDSQGEVTLDKLCYKISLKEQQDLESLLIKLQNSGYNLVSIIRVIIRHFYRLYQVKHLITQGKTDQQAMSSLFPPVFFKQVNDFNRSLRLWDDKQLLTRLNDLTELEMLAKKDILTAELMFKNIVLN